MAIIDILNIKPTSISRDLKNKYLLIYGKPKTGKTTFAASFKKNLILATEVGFNFLSGATVQTIERWSDYRLVIRQLAKPEAKEKYDTITIDTVSILYDLCKKYVAGKHGVADISEISWGRGYAEVKKEFEDSLRSISLMGYGIILIAHSKTRTEIDVNGSEEEIVSPDLDKRAAQACNALVDIVGYIHTSFDENGNSERHLYTRQTPYLFAGSRIKHLPAKIKLGYDELVNAIAEAIEKEAEEGGQVVDSKPDRKKEQLDYEEIRDEAQKLWVSLIEKDKNNASLILKKIEEVMQQPMKLSEFTEPQVESLYLVVAAMREM